MTEPAITAPPPALDLETEGIKYTGSKAKLLRPILELAHKTGAKTVLDGFSGSTRVSQALARNGFQVMANDTAIWSKVLGDCYLNQHENPDTYQELLNHLNALPPKSGWFTEHYGGQPNHGCAIQNDGQKKPWQIHNTMKLDAIREAIDTLELDATTRAVMLTSLMLALDKVDNTLGHYVSYLKEWSPRSYNTMELKLPALFENTHPHTVLQGDVFDAIAAHPVDLAYFDPPYGSNNEKMPPSRVRYASYYHIWKTICLNDKPELFGKSNRRTDTSDTQSASVFEEFRKNDNGYFIATQAIENLLRATQARYILLSYSSGGRATAGELLETIENTGTLEEIIELDYKQNVMASMKWTHNWLRELETPHREFLFLLRK